MVTRRQTSALAQLYDAAKAPARWSAALQSVAESVGGIGVGQVVLSKGTGAVEWVTITGPCAELEPRYVSHYAPHDLYLPVLNATAVGRWMSLSHSLSESDMRGNAWYNDFILKTGIADILAAKMHEDEETIVLLGIQRGTASEKTISQFNAHVGPLLQPLARAARLHVAFRRMGRALSAANLALQYLSVGVVLTDADGHVLETNELAADILRLKDGLQMRGGRLTALRSFESSKLAAIVAGKSESADGHLLIGRRGDRRPYAVTVAPLNADEGGRRIAMILIVNPDWQNPSERSVAEFFGLSPAESRLAAALMKGRKLREIARDTGVEVTTLRTQLSSILKKVGVARQVDLVRMLSSIGPTNPHSA